MLLTDENLLKININDVDIEIKITFNVLSNLYNFLQDSLSKSYGINVSSPFKIIEDLKGNNTYLAVLLFCMADGKIPYVDLLTLIKDDNIKIDYLKQLIESAIISSMIWVERDKETQKDSKESTLQDFEDYFNTMYCSSKILLNLTKNEFLNITPKELKALLSTYKNCHKEILLTAYIEVLKSRTKKAKPEEKIIQVKDANDFFNMI